MLCREVMTSKVFACRDVDPADRCAQLMRERDIGFVPVLDGEDRPVGVVTDRDLALRVLAPRKPVDTPLYAVMSGDVATCRGEDDLRTAEATMTAVRKSRLVVVDGTGRCVGVLSLSDVARADRAHAGTVLRGVTDREVRRVPPSPAR